ncbi:MAG: hypothetical protein Q8K78_09630, partial [Planctomycetaceae bacterium]|nr:hypothetical protein [Planctomycetaceae bacterium]
MIAPRPDDEEASVPQLSSTDETAPTDIASSEGVAETAPLGVVGASPAGDPFAFDLEAILTDEGENSVVTEAELVPARMLNEFTYCPRLAYLEWVQGEFRENLETREGTFGHRNVDRPTTKSFESPAPASDDEEVAEDILSADRLAARALQLSAPSEGLLAKLDLIELKGRRAVPIDYKRGTVPDNGQQSWEPERVQLCAQGLILRANGYE